MGAGELIFQGLSNFGAGIEKRASRLEEQEKQLKRAKATRAFFSAQGLELPEDADADTLNSMGSYMLQATKQKDEEEYRNKLLELQDREFQAKQAEKQGLVDAYSIMNTQVPMEQDVYGTTLNVRPNATDVLSQPSGGVQRYSSADALLSQAPVQAQQSPSEILFEGLKEGDRKRASDAIDVLSSNPDISPDRKLYEKGSEEYDKSLKKYRAKSELENILIPIIDKEIPSKIPLIQTSVYDKDFFDMETRDDKRKKISDEVINHLANYAINNKQPQQPVIDTSQNVDLGNRTNLDIFPEGQAQGMVSEVKAPVGKKTTSVSAMKQAGGLPQLLAKSPELRKAISSMDVKDQQALMSSFGAGTTKDRLELLKLDAERRKIDQQTVNEQLDEDIKRGVLKEKDRDIVQQQLSSYNNAINTSIAVGSVAETAKNIEELFNTGILPVGGKGGAIVDYLPITTNASDVRKLNQQILSDAALGVLRDLRSQGTGSGLGATSNLEIEMLQKSLESLDPDLSPEIYLKNLRDYTTLRYRTLNTITNDLQIKGLPVPPEVSSELRQETSWRNPRKLPSLVGVRQQQ